MSWIDSQKYDDVKTEGKFYPVGWREKLWLLWEKIKYNTEHQWYYERWEKREQRLLRWKREEQLRKEYHNMKGSI